MAVPLRRRAVGGREREEEGKEHGNDVCEWRNEKKQAGKAKPSTQAEPADTRTSLYSSVT